MSERSDILESISSTIKDYRADEIAELMPEHVDRWVRQFGEDVQIPLLREVDHVLKHTYFSKQFVSEFFANQIKHEKLAGANPCAFWQEANLLRNQAHGHSQAEILALFGESLAAQCGIAIEGCGSTGGTFIYLDDVLFSGSRIGSDLKAWIQKGAPAAATVHILVIATHHLGEWQCIKGLKEAAASASKKIEFHCWAAVRFENRKKYRDTSEVLWPAVIPDDEGLAAYMAQESRFPFESRSPGGKLEHGIFSSEEGRQLIERELLLAGVRIRGGCQDPKRSIRPLGFSLFGLGFGSMIVTFRNCPNNCPLALWWGDPEATSGPFHWYPLFPRKTYEQGIDFDAISF
jgi:hypothetical protein